MSKHTEAYEEMFHPPKPKRDPNIWCYKCKSQSGWADSDLILMRGHYKLNCKNCGKVCINGLSNIPDGKEKGRV